MHAQPGERCCGCCAGPWCCTRREPPHRAEEVLSIARGVVNFTGSSRSPWAVCVAAYLDRCAGCAPGPGFALHFGGVLRPPLWRGGGSAVASLGWGCHVVRRSCFHLPSSHWKPLWHSGDECPLDYRYYEISIRCRKWRDAPVVRSTISSCVCGAVVRHRLGC